MPGSALFFSLGHKDSSFPGTICSLSVHPDTKTYEAEQSRAELTGKNITVSEKYACVRTKIVGSLVTAA